MNINNELCKKNYRNKKENLKGGGKLQTINSLIFSLGFGIQTLNAKWNLLKCRIELNSKCPSASHSVFSMWRKEQTPFLALSFFPICQCIMAEWKTELIRIRELLS
jgi:hypothetical protein